MVSFYTSLGAQETILHQLHLRTFTASVFPGANLCLTPRQGLPRWEVPGWVFFFLGHVWAQADTLGTELWPPVLCGIAHPPLEDVTLTFVLKALQGDTETLGRPGKAWREGETSWVTLNIWNISFLFFPYGFLKQLAEYSLCIIL